MTNAMGYIQELNKRGSVLGLDNIQALLARLGNPEQRIPVIHIAGTNGKGSTLALIEGVLRQAGFRVGKYTSPTIVSYYERFQIDGESIPATEFNRYIERVKEAVGEIEAEGFYPTAFEVETAVAFLYCGQADVMLLETGMGGRLDSTNVVPEPLVTVLASISMDHMQYLGDNLECITREKAGILRPYIPCVSNPANASVPEVADTLRRYCREIHADYRQLERTYTVLEADSAHTLFRYQEASYVLKLPGLFQVENALTAIEAVKAAAESWYAAWEQKEQPLWLRRTAHIRQCLKRLEQKAVIRDGLMAATWPVRFERVASEVELYMDGAHNVDACIRLTESIRQYFARRYCIFIVGVLADKEYEKMMHIMAPYASEIYTITPDNPRALTADRLAEVCERDCETVCACDSLQQAYEAVCRAVKQQTKARPVVLCFGSLSYLGDMKQVIWDTDAMRRFNGLLWDERVRQRFQRLETLEQDRIYCRHDMEHALAVARIGYIRILEEHAEIPKELFYAAALLHDLGRVEQYETGMPHHKAGAAFAEEILTLYAFTAEERMAICAAIDDHEQADMTNRSQLGRYLYLADKASRSCFACAAQESCKWDAWKKNISIFV